MSSPGSILLGNKLHCCTVCSITGEEKKKELEEAFYAKFKGHTQIISPRFLAQGLFSIS